MFFMQLQKKICNCIFVYTFQNLYIHFRICIYILGFVYTFKDLYIHFRICIYILGFVYTCIYMYIHFRTCIYICFEAFFVYTNAWFFELLNFSIVKKFKYFFSFSFRRTNEFFFILISLPYFVWKNFHTCYFL